MRGLGGRPAEADEQPPLGLDALAQPHQEPAADHRQVAGPLHQLEGMPAPSMMPKPVSHLGDARRSPRAAAPRPPARRRRPRSISRRCRDRCRATSGRCGRRDIPCRRNPTRRCSAPLRSALASSPPSRAHHRHVPFVKGRCTGRTRSALPHWPFGPDRRQLAERARRCRVDVALVGRDLDIGVAAERQPLHREAFSGVLWPALADQKVDDARVGSTSSPTPIFTVRAAWATSKRSAVRARACGGEDAARLQPLPA